VTDGPPAGGGQRQPGSLRRADSPGYRHVVFDLDGTLVDSRADLVDAMNHVLRALGRAELAPVLLSSFVGEGARRLVERAMGDAPPALVDDALARFVEWYGAHLLDRTAPYPGVVDVLAALASRGVVLSVLSNKPEAMSRAIMAGLGLDRLFLAIVGGDSLASAELICAVEEKFSCDFPLETFFERPTIATMDALLKQHAPPFGMGCRRKRID